MGRKRPPPSSNKLKLATIQPPPIYNTLMHGSPPTSRKTGAAFLLNLDTPTDSSSSPSSSVESSPTSSPRVLPVVRSFVELGCSGRITTKIVERTEFPGSSENAATFIPISTEFLKSVELSRIGTQKNHGFVLTVQNSDDENDSEVSAIDHRIKEILLELVKTGKMTPLDLQNLLIKAQATELSQTD